MVVSQLQKFIKKGKYEKRLSIVRNTYAFFHKWKFGKIGKGSYIWKPTFLSGTEYFFFGDKVGFWPGARIEAIDEWGGYRFKPRFTVGNNVNIGQDCHITLAEKIDIESDVVCSARVTITDISHVTDDVKKAVLNQDIRTKPVRICKGAFVGINSTVLPGVTIGEHAVVGANSVVTKDVPAYSTVAGSPARIIRKQKC